MRFLVCLAMLAMLMGHTSQAQCGENGEPMSYKEDVAVKKTGLPKKGYKKDSLGDVLINGEVVTEGWEQVVLISMSGARCSATLIGPKVAMTAAHCVETGGRPPFHTKV